MSPLVQNFLTKQKEICEKKAVFFAKTELQFCDTDNYKSELKQHFGFNDKTLIKRKKELQKLASA